MDHFSIAKYTVAQTPLIKVIKKILNATLSEKQEVVNNKTEEKLNTNHKKNLEL